MLKLADVENNFAQEAVDWVRIRYHSVYESKKSTRRPSSQTTERKQRALTRIPEGNFKLTSRSVLDGQGKILIE
jgi:hypothetical protein